MNIICFKIASLNLRKTLVVFALAVSISGAAQEFPTYGKVTGEELKMKECPFDKEATAVVLIDEAISYHNTERNLITNRHVRIKILKDKAVDYGNIVIRFYKKDGFEFLSEIEGMVVNTDESGNTTTQNLDKKAIFTKALNEFHGETRLAFPSVKAGSIIEYKYKSTMKHYGGLDDWEFQKEIPVVQSKYMLYVLPGSEFTYQIRKSDACQIKINPEPKDGRVTFEMENIPGLEDEPYMDARRDYLQRVIFQLSGIGSGEFDKKKITTTWEQLTKEMMNSQSLGVQLNKDLSGTESFIGLVKDHSSALEKMKLVLNHVRQNMTWNGYNSRVSIDGVKSAWSKKKGTNGDINLILINLLKAAGLEVYPMLVSERYHGKVNTQYPFEEQFNTIYAAVFAEGKKYYLDATDPITPPHIIPYNILNTTAFILNKKLGGLVNITDETLQYRDFITVMAQVTTETIKGEVLLNSIDYARIRRLEKYNSNNSRYIDENFKYKASLRIDSFSMANEDKDSLALEQKFVFSTPLEGTGDYKFIPLNMFSGFEKNPFLSEKRFSDINFSYKRLITITNLIRLPDGFSVDALPKSIQMTNVDKSVLFVRELFKDERANQVVCRIKMDFRKSHYTAGEYDDIREFYKKMFEMLNEQIVLKKKN